MPSSKLCWPDPPNKDGARLKVGRSRYRQGLQLATRQEVEDGKNRRFNRIPGGRTSLWSLKRHAVWAGAFHPTLTLYRKAVERANLARKYWAIAPDFPCLSSQLGVPSPSAIFS